MMALDWETFYSSFWQFIVTQVVLLIASIVILLLLGRTVRDFWFVKHISFNPFDPTDSGNTLFIKPIIKYLTSSYLILGALYILTSLTMRTYIVFFGGRVWCWIPDYIAIFLLFSRINLHLLFLVR